MAQSISSALTDPEEHHGHTQSAATHQHSAVLSAPQHYDIQTLPSPLCGDDEVIVQVEGCGLCASSIPVWEGRAWFDYPMPAGAPGHEAWGRVIARGDRVDNVIPGERVTCLAENAYTEQLRVAAKRLVVLPPELDGMPFPGEAIGCAMNIFRRADIQADQSVAIIGAGFLGLLLVQLAVGAGASVTVLSRRECARRQALELGAAEAFDTEDWWGNAQRVVERTAGRGCERVIEVTGLQFALDMATEMIGEYGKLVIGGYHQDDLRQVNMQKWNWRAIDVVNAHERDPRRCMEGIEMGVKATLEGRIRPQDLLTHKFPMQDIDAAFRTLLERPEGFIKAWVAP
ncbi:MDR/zinc-dependent alcohol dehydrogenase-like family protein [Gilvimarinus sp. F26214L]|uniref:MDR/zinc-dependent alcohol dehydrogenase-like family protein n=1 Tax=Gilvimarinus sp. DZF01 TaxID=3461371 RepID=UPI0040457DBB